MNIGNVRIDPPVLLGPMAGVTDMPFRVICKQQGCGMAYTEMVSAKAIFYGNIKTNGLLEISKEEGQAGVQLFGSDPKILSEMAKKIDCDAIAIFDVNMGCPVPKVVNNGEGSALMKNPLLVGEIVEALSKAVNKPITIKIRKGFNDNSVNAVEIARIAQESGAQAVTVHGRTREQYYSGKADWDIISQVKDALKIPVIGNGDIFAAEDAWNMLKITGCDGVMVARGAEGNPWIFAQIKHYLETGEKQPGPTRDQIIIMIEEHAKMLADCKGEFIAIREMRRHISSYTKGIQHAAKLRKEANRIENMAELINHLELLRNLTMVH